MRLKIRHLFNNIQLPIGIRKINSFVINAFHLSKARTALLIFIFSIRIAYAQIYVDAAYSKPTAEKNRATVEIGTIALPNEPAPGEVRVAMKCAQICQSDRRILTGTKKSEALVREIVLGHEGVGRVSQMSADLKSENLQIGSYVVILPHYVPDNDPTTTKGFPNLSPNMKHIGFSLNGVFAEQMDFPKYNIFPISEADTMIRKFGENRYLEQMVNAEPLACVQRAFKLLDLKQPKILNRTSSRILILGAGPMGLLHALHARMKYPHAQVMSYDTNSTRRSLAKQILGKSAVLDSTAKFANSFDVVVTSTSSGEANSVDAPNLVKNNGVIVLFSGINMHKNEQSPKINGVNIEDVHRREDVKQIQNYRQGSHEKNFMLLGSSGYTKTDIATSVSELHADLLGSNPSYHM